MAGPTARSITSMPFDGLDARTFHEIVRLRCDVFVVEQQCAYPELDGRDVEPGTRHHWITADDGTMVVYARTLSEPDGVTRVGRVVTAPAARGRGSAARLIGHLVEATEGELVLDAQSHLAEWYRRFGFEPAGDEFVEDGIAHVPMRLERRRGAVGHDI